jgi:DNA-binding LacI/PurR family transcriptional regulator
MSARRSGRQRPVGIRDVASAAGVSVASASFALNGQSGVAPETRARILQVAESLGYRANPQAQALRRGRTNIFGLVVRNFSNPFFLDVMLGAEQVAGEVGASLIVLDSQYSSELEEQQVREMAGRHVQGLAIAPVGAGESIRLWQSLRPGAPAVALNAAVEGIDGVRRVAPDNETAVDAPLRRLAELGHRSIAFLSAPRPLVADQDRLRRYRTTMRELGLVPLVMYAELSPAGVQDAATRLLRKADAPTAIVTNSDYAAHGVYMAARDLGMGVGPTVSVVGHDDLPTSELLDPPLSTVRVDRREMGRELMVRLLDDSVREDYVAPVEYVERDSVQAPFTERSPGRLRALDVPKTTPRLNSVTVP